MFFPLSCDRLALSAFDKLKHYNMKQIFILVIFASISTALFAKTENLTKSEIQISFLKPKKIDVWYHTNNGYHIHIIGTLSHNWSFTTWTFNGSVTITGNGVNITFPVSTTMGLRIAGDGRKATTVIWLTENQLANEILNSQEIVDEFLADINAE
jgi:hypothetical protein